MRRILLPSLLTALLTLTLHAQGTRTPIDVSRRGPQVGERVPEFALHDQTGKEQTLQSLMGSRGLMLVFIRSADW